VTIGGGARILAALACGAVAGCQGEGTPQAAGSGSAGSAVAMAIDAAGAPVADAAADEPSPDRPDRVDPTAEAQIEDLGAISAWQAVVDRDRLLARRGQHGVAYGRVGAAITITGDAGVTPTGQVWLIDDTEGNGALAIRVVWPPGATAPAEGDRVAVGGGWALDAERAWFWQADRVSPLPAAAPSTIPEPPVAPGHLVGTGDPPSGWKPVAQAKDDGVISFQIVGPPPVNEGDGWTIANELGDPPAAILYLPGERPSYGGHDLRAADERWRLKRGVDYWVRIGKVRRRSPDAPPTINARTAPVAW
jgi:hypothetical protein